MSKVWQLRASILNQRSGICSVKIGPRTPLMKPRLPSLPRRIDGMCCSRSRLTSKMPPGFRLTRILVPIDFTKESIKPLRHACSLAEAQGGRFLLLHVTPPIKSCVDCGYGPVNRKVRDDAQTRRDRYRLQRFAARQLGEKFPVDVLVRSGTAAEEIVGVAQEQKADLIILCAHEKSDMNSIRPHETVERVARRAPCPVLVVR